jgi:hypothetical protein
VHFVGWSVVNYLSIIHGMHDNGIYDISTNVIVATNSDVEMNVAIKGLINLFHTLLKSHVCISIPGINILRFRSSFIKGKRTPARFR